MIRAVALYTKILKSEETFWLPPLWAVVFVVQVISPENYDFCCANESLTIFHSQIGPTDPGINLRTAPYVAWMKQTTGPTNFFCTY